MVLRVALVAVVLLSAAGAQDGPPVGKPPLRERAQKGDVEAQFTLGKNYEAGRGGLKKDFGEAARWYKAAAIQNDPFAQASLGLLYRFGKGVIQDDAKAYMWFTLAMQKLTGPDRESIAELRKPLEARMDSSQIENALAAAKAWKPQPAQ